MTKRSSETQFSPLRGLRPYPRPPWAAPFHTHTPPRLGCLKVNKYPNKPLFRRFDSLSSRPRRGPEKTSFRVSQGVHRNSRPSLVLVKSFHTPPRLGCLKVNKYPNKPLFRRFDSLSSRPRRGPEKTSFRVSQGGPSNSRPSLVLVKSFLEVLTKMFD